MRTIDSKACTYAAWQDNLPSSQPATGRSEALTSCR
jgi:hypothetical protein